MNIPDDYSTQEENNSASNTENRKNYSYFHLPNIAEKPAYILLSAFKELLLFKIMHLSLKTVQAVHA